MPKKKFRYSVWFHHIRFEKSRPRKWYNEILPGLLLLMFTLKELGFVINFPAIWLRLCFFYWSTRYHISRSVLTLSWWPREWAIKIQTARICFLYVILFSFLLLQDYSEDPRNKNPSITTLSCVLYTSFTYDVIWVYMENSIIKKYGWKMFVITRKKIQEIIILQPIMVIMVVASSVKNNFFFYK